MRKGLVIFLLVFHITGQLFLPCGNFCYIEQIPELFLDFKEANNSDSFFEFVQEQFIEHYYAAEEENEARPVPFHEACTAVMPVLAFHANIDIIPVSKEKDKPLTTYILKEYWVNCKTIFHPPKAFQVA